MTGQAHLTIGRGTSAGEGAGATVNARVVQEREPASEAVVEVAPKVLRLQLPITVPGIRHVNCHAFVDARGITLLDPGLPTDASWDALRARLRSVDLSVGDVHTIVVSHGHPDHYGLTQRIVDTAKRDVVVIAHATFVLGPDRAGRETPWGRRWQPPPEMRRIPRPRPTVTRHVRDGDVIRLAGRDLVVVFTPGHTPDHICLHDMDTGALYSGDHVMPTTTPYVMSIGEPDILGTYFDSLDRTAALREITNVVPAHGQPFDDLTGRIDEIRDHHETRLGRLHGFVDEDGPATVPELAHRLFPNARESSAIEAETYAHLERLRALGMVARRGTGSTLVYDLAPV